MKLVEARARAEYSQERLARDTHTGTASIWSCENGRQTPRIETCLKLAKALNMDPRDIDEFRPVIERMDALIG